MQSISTIGLDIAKSVFQVHSVNAAGQVIIRRDLGEHPSARTAADPGSIASTVIFCGEFLGFHAGAFSSSYV
jgi:hypothetical protein